MATWNEVEYQWTKSGQLRKWSWMTKRSYLRGEYFSHCQILGTDDQWGQTKPRKDQSWAVSKWRNESQDFETAVNWFHYCNSYQYSEKMLWLVTIMLSIATGSRTPSKPNILPFPTIPPSKVSQGWHYPLLTTIVQYSVTAKIHIIHASIQGKISNTSLAFEGPETPNPLIDRPSLPHTTPFLHKGTWWGWP